MATAFEAPDSVWLRRLAQGAGFCCLLGLGAGQAIEAFWRDVFSTTRPGSRILEIGCGSGDVSVWAGEADRQLDIIASDIHDNAEVVRRHPSVRFLGNARAEALPIDSASIDMVVSNFAFEYTPFPQLAVSELGRVLQPRGMAALVVHSHDSIVTAGSRLLLNVYEDLIAADIPRRIRVVATLTPDDASRQGTLKEVLKMRAAFPGNAPGFSAEVYFNHADRLLSGAWNAEHEYVDLEEKVDVLVQVSKAQIRSARDRPGLAELERQFSLNGMKSYSSEITGYANADNIKKFGWLVFVNKAVHPG